MGRVKNIFRKKIAKLGKTAWISVENETIQGVPEVAHHIIILFFLFFLPYKNLFFMFLYVFNAEGEQFEHLL